MSRYGIDYYGLGYYGSNNPITFDASPFKATPSKQGQILLTWSDPTGNWSRLVVVRNPYGYPLDPWDGTQVISAYNGYDPLVHIDEGLVQGQYYYYSIFVFSLIQYNWVIAGKAFALSVKDCGNSKKLYDYLPNIYKITQPYTATTDDWENADLYAFLSNFGFELDYEQTLTDLLRGRYNTEKVNGNLVPTMMNQFGQAYEPAIGLQQNRKILRDSVTLTKQKGSKEGLAAFIKDFTSWAIPAPISGTPNPSVNGLTVSHNIMLDYNDSSFEEGTGHWISSDGTAQMDNLQVLKIKQLELISNVATFYVGAHNYDVGNQIFVSGLQYPLFNSLTAYTLTGVDQAAGTVSFSLTGSNVTLTSGYNPSTNAYGLITPSPVPWVEPTAPALFPNKATGTLALYNTSSSAQTISAFVADDDPINKGIPVTAGLSYSFSIYASKGGFTARTVTAKIKWFDRFGASISTSSGTGVSDNTVVFSDSYRPSVTATAPSNAYYACPGVSIASVGGTGTNEHHYFDAAQFEQSSSVTAFDEARQLHLTLKANRINELVNPSFVSPTTPWTLTQGSSATINTILEPNAEVFTITSGVISSNTATIALNLPHSYQVSSQIVITGVTGPNASKYNGVRTITAVTANTFSYTVTASNSSISTGSVYASASAYQITASGSAVKLDSWDGSTNAQLMGIYYPNTSYTFSIYAQSVDAPESVTAVIKWYDSSHVLISSSTGDAVTTSTTNWVRPYVIGEAPSTTAYASVELQWSTTSGHKLNVDLALFENAGQVLDYFDGTSGPGDVYDLIWEGGSANAGRSHLYHNRFSTQTRLIGATLDAQLPLGSTAAVYLAQPRT
jgi:hypothetical protein